MKISLQHIHALIFENGAFSHKIGYVTTQDSKYRRAANSHYWFKSYGDFAEWLDFAYWWSCIGKGLRLQAVQKACFGNIQLG